MACTHSLRCRFLRKVALIYADDEFSEMRPGFHTAECLWQVTEAKYLIHNWLEMVEGDGPIHFKKMGAGAHVDALDMDLAVQDGCDLQRLTGLREDANLRYGSADIHGLEGLREGASPADFDDKIGAFACGLFEDPLDPVGMLLVIDACIEAAFFGAGALFIAAGCAEHTRAEQLCKLESKDRDATGSLNDHCISGLDAAGMDHCIPCCDSGAGERGGLLPGEMIGQGNDAAFGQDHIFGEHSVYVASEGAAEFRWRRRAVQPVLHKDAGDAVAGFGPSHFVSDGNHLACPVRGRDPRQVHAGVVLAECDHEITVVEGDGAYFDEDLMRSGLRNGFFSQLQMVYAESWNLPEFHSASPFCW